MRYCRQMELCIALGACAVGILIGGLLPCGLIKALLCAAMGAACVLLLMQLR